MDVGDEKTMNMMSYFFIYLIKISNIMKKIDHLWKKNDRINKTTFVNNNNTHKTPLNIKLKLNLITVIINNYSEYGHDDG